MRAYFNLDAQEFPVTVEHIGAEWHQDQIIRYQGFPHFHWLQTQRGAGNFWVGNQHFVLQPGAGILVSPGVPHRYEPLNKNEDWQVVFVTFQGKFAEDFNQQMMNREYVYIAPERGAIFTQQVEEIIKNLDTESVDKEWVSALSYYLLLSLGHEEAHQVNINHPDFKQYVKPAMDYMNDNFTGHLTITAVARYVNVTPQYLDRLFQKILNLSPKEYLLQIRINHAKKLLVSQKHLRVVAVASESGFRDAAYFSRVFKRKTGVTPLNFRKWQT
ncbi:AraC family transcriptional regulator [Weissella bombi]|uniref:AraC-like ligand binding domain-containing protein n=1 Tax=Weissella bombi TaxID=1505725 RepID=A0A1C3Z282_9LACO|nr:AraC family transcriptional regulator [Weissella bombi]SCB76382.1 AraC-like ligand binding domain-containing protein [Weissella bombi]